MLALATLLCACSMLPVSVSGPAEELAIACGDDAQCAGYWPRVRLWAEQNSPYGVRSSTDWIVLGNSPPVIGTGLSYRITRWPAVNGKGKIVFEQSCATLVPCFPRPATSFAHFNQFVTAP